MENQLKMLSKYYCIEMEKLRKSHPVFVALNTEEPHHNSILNPVFVAF